jgi:hypothetical protein
MPKVAELRSSKKKHLSSNTHGRVQVTAHTTTVAFNAWCTKPKLIKHRGALGEKLCIAWRNSYRLEN